MAIRTKGGRIRRRVRAMARQRHDVMDFEVGQAVAAHERSGSITAFAESVYDRQHPCFHCRVSHVRGRNRRHHGWLKVAEWTRSKCLLPQCRHVPVRDH